MPRPDYVVEQLSAITFANSLDPDQARKMSGLIQIQTVRHSDEVVFLKS